jgi:hypothetical protein
MKDELGMEHESCQMKEEYACSKYDNFTLHMKEIDAYGNEH